MEMSISPGMIEAKVRGGLKAPYSVKLRARVPDEAAIGNVIRRLREKAAYKAALMFGEIPEELGEIFRSAGVTLSMSRFAKVQRMCGCAESRDMCKHVLAVVYVAALAFDRDPFLLLKLRGLGKRKLITALCAPEGAEPPRLPAVPGECDAACGETEKNAAPGGAQDARDADFYGSGGILPDLLNARTASPPGLRRAMPVFDFPLWRGETSFADSIAPYYKMVKKFIGREE
jgi:uncharacterized Zn finger protein